MEAAEEDVSLPWRWILEHLVDVKEIGPPILREMMTYVPNLALYSSLQKRTALRYLEEAIAGDRIDAHVIPLVAVLLKESQETSSYPRSSDYSVLLLRVQVEAVLAHIRGKPRDWQGFSQALDRIFPEDTVDARFLKKRKELLTLWQVQGREKRCGEVLETYSLIALRRDLLKCITSEKARLERTFLDKLLQDVFTGKYPVSAGSIGKPASEIEGSQEDFHSADEQRNSIGSDDQTVIGGRNSNAESEEAVETTLKDSAAMHMTRDDSTSGVHQKRKRVFSQTFNKGNGPSKKSVGHRDLRQRDQQGKVVTSISPMKGMRESYPMSPSNEEVSLEVADDSLRVEFLDVGSDGHEEFCHKCREGGRLLCCDGCPIAVHRKCLGFDSKSFTEEEWFCPLCAEKRAVEAVAKAREEEQAARRRVLHFMTGVDGKRAHEKRMHTPTGSKRASEANSGKKSILDDTKKLVDVQPDGGMGFEKPTSKPDANKKASSPLKGTEKQNLAPHKRNSIEASMDPYEAFLDITTKAGRPSCPSYTNVSDTVYEKDRRKGKKIEEPKVQDATCNEIAEEVPESLTGADGFTSSRHTNIASSSKAGQTNQVENYMEQADIQVQGDGDGHDGDLEDDREGRKSESPIKKDRRLYFRGNRIIPGMRRKRLQWSKVEEDALREGVKRFSHDNGGWGFQWTRILEFGQGKFHPSRTDVDLKDKWRNLAKTLQ